MARSHWYGDAADEIINLFSLLAIIAGGADDACTVAGGNGQFGDGRDRLIAARGGAEAAPAGHYAAGHAGGGIGGIRHVNRLAADLG